MATACWDRKYVLYVDFLDCQNTATAECCYGRHERIQQAIYHKSPKLLCQGVINLGSTLSTRLVCLVMAMAGELQTTLPTVLVSCPLIFTSLDPFRSTWWVNDLQPVLT